MVLPPWKDLGGNQSGIPPRSIYAIQPTHVPLASGKFRWQETFLKLYQRPLRTRNFARFIVLGRVPSNRYPIARSWAHLKAASQNEVARLVELAGASANLHRCHGSNLWKASESRLRLCPHVDGKRAAMEEAKSLSRPGRRSLLGWSR